MTLADYTEPMLLVPHLLSDTQAGAIRELAKRLHRAERIDDAEAFCAPVLEREACMPTLIGNSVALPHTRGSGVQHLSLAIGFSPDGIPWPGRDALVHLVILSAIPFAETQIYLSVLSSLSKLLQNDSALSDFNAATRSEQMLEILAGLSVSEPERSAC